MIAPKKLQLYCRQRFNSRVVHRLQDRLQSILLEMVTRERNGDVIDRSLMRSITMVRTCPFQHCIVIVHGACAR